MQHNLNDALSLTFYNHEIAFVLSLLTQNNALVNEITGSASQTKKKGKDIQKSLVSRGYLSEQGDIVILDETIAALAGMLLFSERKISVTQISTGAVVTRQVGLFASHGLVVEQASLTGGQIELTAVRSCEVLLPRVLSFLQITDRKVIDNQSCRLSQKDWTQLPYLLADGDLEDGINFLLHRNIEKNIATRLAKAIAHPQRQSVLQLFESRQSQSGTPANLTIIEDVYGYWIVQSINSIGKIYVEAHAVNAANIRQSVTKMICRLFEGSIG